MASWRALGLALDLARMPALAEAMRRQPLPPDVLALIRIAAGCPETCDAAARATGERPSAVREAAVLYLQQVVLQPAADAYRTLGAQPGTPRGQLREHLRWLMQWLHPDVNASDWDDVFARRVLGAWRDLRDAGGSTDDRRRAPRQAAFPAPRRSSGPNRRSPSRRKLYLPWIARPLAASRGTALFTHRRLAIAMFASTLGLTLIGLRDCGRLPADSGFSGSIGVAEATVADTLRAPDGR